MIVHLVDGTYELFRHFYGLRRFTKGKDRPYGAVVRVLQTVLQSSPRAKQFREARLIPGRLFALLDYATQLILRKVRSDYIVASG